MNKNLMLICIWFILIGLSFLVVASGAPVPVHAQWVIWTILMVYFFFMWGYMKRWHKKEWRKNIIGIVVIIGIFGLGAILFLTIPTFSGLFIAMGFVLIAIGIVVRKFWPHRRGNIGISFFSFRTSEWFALAFNGGLCIAIAVMLLCLGV